MRPVSILLIVLLIGLLLATTLISYHDDDWYEQAWASRGLVGTVNVAYQTWTGKYSYALAVGVFKPLNIPALPTLLAVGIILLSLRALLPVTPYRDIGICLLTVTVILVSPAAIECWFWQSGAFGYALGIALACLLFWSFTRSALLAALVAFVLAGTTDTMAVLLPIVLGFVLMLYPAYRRAIAAALLAALLGLVIDLLAPGTAVRAGVMPHAGIVVSAWYALRTTGVFVAKMLNTAPLAVGAWLLFLWWYVPPYTLDRHRKHQRLLVVIVGLLAVNFAAAFTSYYSMSVQPGERASIIPIFFTLIGLMEVIRLIRPGNLIAPKSATAVLCVLLFGSIANIVAIWQMLVQLRLSLG